MTQAVTQTLNFLYFHSCLVLFTVAELNETGCYEAVMVQSFAIWIYIIDPLCVAWTHT